LSAIPLVLASAPTFESKPTIVSSPPQSRTPPIEFLQGRPAHHHKDGNSHKSATARDKNLALRKTLEASRGAGATAKARRTRSGVVTSHSMHRASGETMSFGPRDDVNVHGQIEGDGRAKELFEERLRLWHRREITYPKHPQELLRRSQIAISLVQMRRRAVVRSDQRQSQRGVAPPTIGGGRLQGERQQGRRRTIAPHHVLTDVLVLTGRTHRIDQCGQCLGQGDVTSGEIEPTSMVELIRTKSNNVRRRQHYVVAELTDTEIVPPRATEKSRRDGQRFTECLSITDRQATREQRKSYGKFIKWRRGPQEPGARETESGHRQYGLMAADADPPRLGV
jgi:hypothetical protein